MSRELTTIAKLLPPPAKPIGLNRPWNTIEAELQVNLPKDYKDFIDLYGSGRACEEIVIWNLRDTRYFKSPLQHQICGKEGVIRLYEKIRSMGNEWPYSMYPQPGGLLPFASILDVDHLNWLTAGKPDKWDVVFWDFDNLDFIHLKGDSFAKYLLKVLRKEYPAKSIPQFDPPYKFQPQ